jgi:hypothetical protein
MLGLVGLGLVLWGLWTGLGGWPFLFTAVGIVLLVAEDERRRRSRL